MLVRQIVMRTLPHRANSVMQGIMRPPRRLCVRTAHLDIMTLMTIHRPRVMEQRAPVLQDHTLLQDRHYAPLARKVKQTSILIRRVIVCSVQPGTRVKLVQRRALRVLWAL